MSFVDTTAALAKANAEYITQAAPTDESLNAGALLPDEPIGDVLTNEVTGEADVIMEMLPKLDVVPETATESIFNDLRYLREDLVTQRGMSQKIATEALAVLPNFNKGAPVNYYSRHASPTGYKAALEEIDSAMQTDLLGQIAGQVNRLDTVAANPGNGFVIENLGFKRRADQVSMSGEILADFYKTAVEQGFQWDDACFRGCAVDRTQNTIVPSILTIPERVYHSFASMDEYYVAHQDAPAMMELMTTHLVGWRTVFSRVLDALNENAEKLSVEAPKAPTVYFSFGSKTTSLENIADIFLSACDKTAPADLSMVQSVDLVRSIGNAAQQARVEDILLRAKSYANIATETSAVLKDIMTRLVAVPNAALADTIYKLISAFATTNKAMYDGYGVMITWCVNAGMATSYGGTLAAKVVEHAWKSVNQCRETMQMRESAYLRLKGMAEDIQIPLDTNVL